MADILKIAESGALILLGAYNAGQLVSNRKQKRMEKRFGIGKNPTRCLDHAEAINELKTDVKSIKQKLDIV